jgi:hypothetical protein
MNFYIYFIINMILRVDSTNKSSMNSEEVIFIKDFYFNKDSINKILENYNKSTNELLSYGEVLEEMKFMIGIYYWYKQNYSTETLNSLTASVAIPEGLSKEESILYGMLVNRYMIVKGVSDAYNQNRENLDRISECFYESLIIEGTYIYTPPNLKTFKPLLREKFLHEIKKYKDYKDLKFTSRVTPTSITRRLQIDKKNKKFKIVLHSSIVYQLQIYNLAILSFDNETTAQNCLKILHTNPSLSLDAFREFLTVQKINFNYTTNNYTSEDLSSEINGLLFSKNIGEFCLIGEKIVIILSKKSLRKILDNKKNTNAEIDVRNYNNIRRIFLKDFQLMKKHVIMFYKKYAISSKLCQKK